MNSYISDLEQKIAIAKRSEQPQIVETVKETRDEIVTVNRTTGTVRTDFKGGKELETYEPLVKAPAEVSWYDKPLEAGMGKIVEHTAEKRVVELASGTVRTDMKDSSADEGRPGSLARLPGAATPEPPARMKEKV